MAEDPCVPLTQAHASPSGGHHHVLHRAVGRIRHRTHVAQFHAMPQPDVTGCGKHFAAGQPGVLAARPTDGLAKVAGLVGTHKATAGAVLALAAAGLLAGAPAASHSPAGSVAEPVAVAGGTGMPGIAAPVAGIVTPGGGGAPVANPRVAPAPLAAVAVPEPSSLALFGMAVLVAGWFYRRYGVLRARS